MPDDGDLGGEEGEMEDDPDLARVQTLLIVH